MAVERLGNGDGGDYSMGMARLSNGDGEIMKL